MNYRSLPLSGPVQYRVHCSLCGQDLLISRMNSLDFEASLGRLTCPGGHAFQTKEGYQRAARDYWTWERLPAARVQPGAKIS